MKMMVAGSNFETLSCTFTQAKILSLCSYIPEKNLSGDIEGEQPTHVHTPIRIRMQLVKIETK